MRKPSERECACSRTLLYAKSGCFGRTEPESGVIVPEYGRKQCGLEPEYAIWIYQNGPAGILLLFNIVLFVLTAYSIYKAQEGAQFARSSSSRQVDTKAR